MTGLHGEVGKGGAPRPAPAPDFEPWGEQCNSIR